MASCSINTSLITVDQPFNISWSGTNYGDNALFLTLGGFDSNGSLAISGKLKDLTYAASGSRNVTISESEYNNKVAEFGTYASYKVALTYYSHSGNNYDTATSTYVPIESYPPTEVSCSAQVVYKEVPVTVNWSCGHIRSSSYTGTWAVGKVTLCKYVSNSYDSSVLVKYYVNSYESGDASLISGSTNVTITTSEFNTALQSLNATTQDDLRFRFYIGDNLDQLYDYTTVPFAMRTIQSPATLTPASLEETEHATLTWPAGIDGEDNPITGYEVSYANGSSSTPRDASATWTVVGTFTGLTCTAPLSAYVGKYSTYRIKSIGTTSDAPDYTYTTVTVRHVVTLTKPTITFKSNLSSRCIYYIGESTVTGAPDGTTVTYKLYRNNSLIATITTVAEEMVIPPEAVAYWGTSQGEFTIQAEVTVENITFYSAMSDPDYYQYSDITPCGEPSNIWLANQRSYGNPVRLTWNAGYDGVDNPIVKYIVQRRMYYDQQTTAYETFAETTNTYLDVYPPSTVGADYNYRICAAGEAGPNYYSDWAYSGNNLIRVEEIPSTIKYYNGTRWVECIIYYRKNSTTTQCNLSVYDNGEFKKCSFQPDM